MPLSLLLFLVLTIFVSAFGYTIYRDAERRASGKETEPVL